MAKKQDTYACTECGWTSTRWVGRGGECQAWGTVAERGGAPARAVSSSVPLDKAVPIGDVPTDKARRRKTSIAELDRVLGDGVVPGAVVLLAGEPGVGKSTLLLDVAAKWARSGERTLYVSGEESASQVRLRAERTGALAETLYLASENDLGTVLGHIEEVKPTLLVLDSVQTIASDSEGAPGGPNQVREVTGAIARVAKREGMAAVIVGHVTKDGSIAGPRTMEHMVDVVLSFEGDRHSGFRMVRATKNRFGPADEVGCFEMNETGIVEVPDPSGLFTTEHSEPTPGTCVTVTLEGRRPLLAEVQALVAPSPNQSSPRRTTHGLDSSRIAMVLAVLERKVRLPLSSQDVYVSTVGGARVTDPSVDLAAAIAIVSAAVDWQYPGRLIALGEVGLAGDLRRVPGVERRLAEAARLGFELALVPKGSRDVTVKVPRLGGLRVAEVASLEEAIGKVALFRPGQG